MPCRRRGVPAARSRVAASSSPRWRSRRSRAQEQDDGEAASYLPDAQVKGLPAPPLPGGDRGRGLQARRVRQPILSGGTSLIPGVGGIVDAITPDINAPTALCPSAFAKDGLGKATSGMWAAGTTVVSVLTDGIEALLSFDIANLLAPVVDDASHRIDAKVVGPLNLRAFAVAAAGIFVGFLFFTGRPGSPSASWPGWCSPGARGG